MPRWAEPPRLQKTRDDFSSTHALAATAAADASTLWAAPEGAAAKPIKGLLGLKFMQVRSLAAWRRESAAYSADHVGVIAA